MDLGSNRFTPVVSPSRSSSCSNYFPMVQLKDTLTFAYENQAMVAITANSGLAISGSSGMAGTCTNTIAGLLVDDRELVSPPQFAGSNLTFTTRTSARIDDLPDGPGNVRWGVAGSNTTDNDCGQLSTQLVTAGVAGACTAPKANTIAPRGGAGVDPTGRYLILAIVQGTEPQSGMTTRDFARLMIALGAYNAVNFDGGGSTAFIWDPGSTPPIDNPHIPATLQKTFPWPVVQEPKDVSQRYLSNSACDSCDPYRPVYASFGLIDQQRVGTAKIFAA